jgi:hypothetical protein
MLCAPDQAQHAAAQIISGSPEAGGSSASSSDVFDRHASSPGGSGSGSYSDDNVPLRKRYASSAAAAPMMTSSSCATSSPSPSLHPSRSAPPVTGAVVRHCAAPGRQRGKRPVPAAPEAAAHARLPHGSAAQEQLLGSPWPQMELARGSPPPLVRRSA